MQIHQFPLVGLVEHVADDAEAEVDDVGKVLAVHKLVEHLLLGLVTKVVILDLRYFGQVILELLRLQLLDIVFANDHVLNEYSQLLVELHYIRTPVNEVLNRRPLLELRVLDVSLQLAAAERCDETAEQLGGDKSLGLRLLNPEDVAVDVKANPLEGLDHLVGDRFLRVQLLGAALRGVILFLRRAVRVDRLVARLAALYALDAAPYGLECRPLL